MWLLKYQSWTMAQLKKILYYRKRTSTIQSFGENLLLWTWLVKCYSLLFWCQMATRSQLKHSQGLPKAAYELSVTQPSGNPDTSFWGWEHRMLVAFHTLVEAIMETLLEVCLHIHFHLVSITIKREKMEPGKTITCSGARWANCLATAQILFSFHHDVPSLQ